MQSLRRDPFVAEIGVAVAVAAVGEERHHRTAAAIGDHLGDQAERPHMSVPVDGPTRRPKTALACRAAAIDAASGTATMRSTTLGRNDGSTRGRPMPSMRDDLGITTSQRSSA